MISGYRNAHGELCRTVRQTVFIGGQPAVATGTMCQQSDGRWALVR